MKSKNSICLSMIVRNESKVIKRCLESIKPLIDHWIVVDTGSTDGTQDIVKEVMKDIPGTLIERPWEDFASNRTEALKLAKGWGDYALLIDADEQIILSEDFELPCLYKDAYVIDVHYGPSVFHREIFVNNRLDWYWKGVMHEQIYCSSRLNSVEVLKGAINLSLPDGKRSLDSNKAAKDAVEIEKALKIEPDNSRYVFYLAQSYVNSGDYDLALQNYEKRIGMGGWDQEVFYAMYAKAYVQELVGMDPNIFLTSYDQAYQYRSIRAEPLFRMGQFYIKMQNFSMAYVLSKHAITIPLPDDSMFVEHSIYKHAALLQYADSAFFVGKYEESFSAYQTLLVNPNFPANLRESIDKNIAILKFKMATIPKMKGQFDTWKHL